MFVQRENYCLTCWWSIRWFETDNNKCFSLLSQYTGSKHKRTHLCCTWQLLLFFTSTDLLTVYENDRKRERQWQKNTDLIWKWPSIFSCLFLSLKRMARFESGWQILGFLLGAALVSLAVIQVLRVEAKSRYGDAEIQDVQVVEAPQGERSIRYVSGTTSCTNY